MHPNPSSTTTPLPAREISSPDPPAPRSKLQLLNFRRRSNPSQSHNRSSSAYEAWIDTALLLAHTPDANQESSNTMARGRSGSVPNGNGEATRERRQASGTCPQNLQGLSREEMPTIRLLPHQDPRSSRPSLAFPPTARTLPHEDCVIRVGRYSERDVNPIPTPNTPSAAPIGFKSKVVSRRHCEFWCSQGQWYIKDVKSSSGTFLNHIRLSQPNMESRPFPVNDGDVVQLGIDFRGGEEMIFRCVKIRVECNRGWQKTLNSYNMSTHKRLRDLGRAAPKKDSDAASTHSSQECSICLMSIAPCQSLFVAPCSHVWHYKCIRPILNDHQNYPQFLCPNCRAITDLDADVDDPLVRWEDEEEFSTSNPEDSIGTNENPRLAPANSLRETADTQMSEDTGDLAISASRMLLVHDGGGIVSNTTAMPGNAAASSDLFLRRDTSINEQGERRLPSGQTQYLRPITPTEPLMVDVNGMHAQTPTLDLLVREGPMTPTNSAGPFVFDGSAGRPTGRSAENASAAA